MCTGNLHLPPWNPSYPLARRRRKPPRNQKPLDGRIRCRSSDGITADMEASRIGVRPIELRTTSAANRAVSGLQANRQRIC